MSHIHTKRRGGGKREREREREGKRETAKDQTTSCHLFLRFERTETGRTDIDQYFLKRPSPA